MADPTPFRRPINWGLFRTDEAERVIRERAKITANVVIVGHPFDQQEERSTITQMDAYDILRTGNILDPAKKNIHGDWEVIVVKRISEQREAGVVTIVSREDNRLFVKTVEWMD